MKIEELESNVVFLDTGIFEKENFFKGNKINQLAELGKNNFVEIKITDITYKEIQKRIVVNLKKASNSYKKAYQQLNGEGKILKNLTTFEVYYKIPKVDIEKEFLKLKEKLDKFISDNKVEIVSSKDASINEVFEQYFSKKPPFGEGQKKDEFPDAFTLNTIKQWCLQNNKKVYVLFTDSDIRSYKNENLLVDYDIVDFLDAVNRKIETKKVETLEKIYAKIKPEIIADVKRNISSDLVNFVTEELDSDPFFDEADLMPPVIENLIIKEYSIAGTNHNYVTLELLCTITFEIEGSYVDYTSAFYDREDSVWLGAESVDRHMIYFADLIFQIDVNLLNESFSNMGYYHLENLEEKNY